MEFRLDSMTGTVLTPASLVLICPGLPSMVVTVLSGSLYYPAGIALDGRSDIRG